MNNESNKKSLLPRILIIIIIALGIGLYLNSPAKPTLATYHEEVYGFDVKYPSSWQIEDSMSHGGCCLFLVNVDTSTTTEQNASGTPVTTVTLKEPVRLQIGYYYRPSEFDPFSMGTSTSVSLGGNKAFTGVNRGVPYYLIPMTSLDGIGASYFVSSDNTDTAGTRKIVEGVLSSIVFTGTTTQTTNIEVGTSTATTTSK